MNQLLSGRAVRTGAAALSLAAVLGTFLIGRRSLAAPEAAAGGTRGSVAGLVALGFKFHGSPSCKGSECHSASGEGKENGLSFLNELTKWSGKDPHHHAYDTLEKNPKSQAIATALKITATSDRCVVCHALSVPKKQQIAGFDVTEGVSCDACHGPSEKWLQPHGTKGWLASQSKLSHEELLKTLGLYDTRDIMARAEQCTGCHLQIDQAMVAAGHPQPKFELNWYSTIYPDRHWHDPDEKYFIAKLWAGGQAVALREAMRQLADRVAAKADAKLLQGAYEQAMGYYAASEPLFNTGIIAGGAKLKADAGKVVAAMTAKKSADVATAAKAVVADIDALAPAIEKVTFDKASDKKLLLAIIDQKSCLDYGDDGLDQQRDAIFAVYNALARTKSDAPANAAAVRKIIGQKLFPKDAKGNFTLPAKDAFVKALAEVKAEVEK